MPPRRCKSDFRENVEAPRGCFLVEPPCGWRNERYASTLMLPVDFAPSLSLSLLTGGSLGGAC